jgi:hypothetical protein
MLREYLDAVHSEILTGEWLRVFLYVVPSRFLPPFMPGKNEKGYINLTVSTSS